jgi:hypothetical protein
MTDIINQQHLDSKKEQVDRSKIPEVQTYANFENILLNIERK